MRRVTIYTRRGCHLCERVEALVAKARRQTEFELEVLDIDADPDLQREYNWEVPVVAVDGDELFGHAMQYEAFLAAARTP